MLESIYWTLYEALEGKTGLLYFYIAIGFVFIKCKKIGYVYAAVIVVWLAILVQFLESSTALYMTEIEKGIAMLFGTLVGGWRFLTRHTQSFGFPFFSIPNVFERIELFFDTRRAKRAYAEELGKEKARQQTGSSGSHQEQKNSGSSNQRSNHSRSSKHSNNEDNKSSSSEEKFRNARSAKQGSNAGTETPWDILGIPEGSTKNEIKMAYRRQANRFHPDKMPDSIRGDADLEVAYNAKFDKIKKAYERLI